MKILKPYQNAQPNHIFQAFGVPNPKPAADASGLTYHPGVDMWFPNCYGTFLVAPEDCLIVNLITPNRLVDEQEGKELTLRGYGVKMQSLSDPTLFYVYWHTLPVFPVEIGQKVKAGEIIAQIGNSGFVMSGLTGGLVPVELRPKPPYPGTHLHYEVFYWKEKKEYIDPVSLIDWTLPVKLDWLNATRQILIKIDSILRGR